MRRACHRGIHRVPLTIVLAALYCALPCVFWHKLRPAPPDSGVLQEADRRDFQWTVWGAKPQLSYQLRYLVAVTAIIPADGLGNRAASVPLMGTMSVADEAGHPLKETGLITLNLPEVLAGQEIRFVAGVYLRSGSYRVSVTVNDPGTGKRNIWHGQVRVPALPGNPLPNWEDHFPRVEFAADVPDGILPGGPRRGMEIWPLAHPVSSIQVPASEPIRIDLVLAGAKAMQPRPDMTSGSRRGGSPPVFLPAGPNSGWFTSAIGVPLQIGSLLSMLNLQNGCVRVSVLDYRQNRVFVDRQDARSVNWEQLQGEIWGPAQKVVSRDALEHWQEPIEFLRQQLVAIAADADGCGAAGQKCRRMVVLVCLDFLVRRGSMITVLDPKACTGCRFYYFHPGIATDWAVTRMLKPARPRTLNFADPRSLGKALSNFLSELNR